MPFEPDPFDLYAYSLDLKHNVVQVTQTPKPGSGLSARATRTAYDATYNKPTAITDPLGRLTTMTYDAATGNLVTVVADAGGLPHLNARSSFTYTTTGQVLTASDPLGTMTVNAYDAKGNVVQVTRDTGRLNQVTRMGYDALGNVTEVTDPNGNVTRTAYDLNRRMTSVIAPKSAASTEALVTRFGYDADGRVLETATGAGSLTVTTRATYTPSGKVATSTDAKGNVTRSTYDVLDRVASIQDPLGRVTSYTYDAMSRRTGVFNLAIQAPALLAQSYTPDGQLASLTDANGNVTSYAYDGFDRLSTTTYPDSSTEGQTYDANDNVLTRTTRAKQTFTYTYDTLNRLSTKTPPASGPVVTYAYDLAGRVTSISDTSSSIVAAVPPTGTTVQYATTATYDPLNRPLGFSWTPAPAQTTPSGTSVTFTHGYNAADQRISQGISDSSWALYPSGASSTSYTANNLNQYTAVGATKPTYDGNGNLTYDGTFSYCYDAENRLTRVITSGTCVSPGTTVATYAYDAQGRRKSKTVGGTTTIYVTDADNREVLEYNGSTGQIQAWYAYGAGLDVLNRMDVPGSTRQTLIPDIQGSIVATLASNTGTLAKRNYLPFGESSTTTGSFAYTGLRIDPETNGLYFARARIYSPTDLGRFLQPDPIGYADGANLYAYVGNDPLNLIDPQGLAVEQFGCGFSGNCSVVNPNNDSSSFFNTAGRVTRDFADAAVAIGIFAITTASMAPSPIQPVATALRVGAGAAALSAARGTSLFRAVGPAELADIKATGALRNLGSAEGKYFTSSAAEASAYAKQAVKAFGDQPYTIIKTDVPNSIFKGLSPATVDRGIPAWVLPSDRLPGLVPRVMDHSPLPPVRF